MHDINFAKKRRLISTHLGKTHKYSYIVFQLALAITNSARLLIFRAAKVTIIKATIIKATRQGN